jgi:Transposase DDE domain group 1
MGVMIDLYCASYATPPVAVTLDIDDTLDVVHGHQQLSLFNAHYDERCFLLIYVYDVATSRPLAVLLRPGKTPSGQEVTGHLRTSCRSPLANQMRLILHTAAYWLMLTLRDAIPKAHALAKAEFATIRLRLIKLGARVIETASRIRLAFAAACPEAALIRDLATTISLAGA